MDNRQLPTTEGQYRVQLNGSPAHSSKINNSKINEDKVHSRIRKATGSANREQQLSYVRDRVSGMRKHLLDNPKTGNMLIIYPSPGMDATPSLALQAASLFNPGVYLPPPGGARLRICPEAGHDLRPWTEGLSGGPSVALAEQTTPLHEPALSLPAARRRPRVAKLPNFMLAIPGRRGRQGAAHAAC